MKMKNKYLKNTFREDEVLVILNEISENKMPGFLKKKECVPDKMTMNHFYSLMNHTINDISSAVLNSTKKLLKRFDENVVLISLLRGGLFAGVGIKESIKLITENKVPHYAISLIKNIGLDLKAIDFILKSHPGKTPVFIDGWVGRGELYNELKIECHRYSNSRRTNLEPNLTVIVDVFGLTPIYGTNQEIFMPESLFGSNISGLIGRTGFISQDQFHFTRMYHEFAPFDLTQFYTSKLKKCLALKVDSIDGLVSEKRKSINHKDLQDYLIENHDLNSEDSYWGAAECYRGLVRKRINELIIKDKKAYYAPALIYMANKKNIKITSDSKLPLFSVCRKEK